MLQTMAVYMFITSDLTLTQSSRKNQHSYVRNAYSEATMQYSTQYICRKALTPEKLNKMRE